MNGNIKRLLSLILCLILFFSFHTLIPVSAADLPPTDTFTHRAVPGGGVKTVVTKPIYEAVQKLSARKLGVKERIGNFVQIKSDGDGNIFILTDQSQVMVLDSQYKYKKTFSFYDEENQPLIFEGATGFFVKSEQEIYIADTTNARVLYFCNQKLQKEILVPESALIPSDFNFQPIQIAQDKKGYLYVLSAGSYYGVVLYDPNGEFVGFYGANTVKGTVLTSLQYVWDTLTQNDVKRAKTVKKLPYQIIDICTDENDFVYTCTGKNAGGAVGQIRMLSPGGTNIMVGAEEKNFGEIDLVKRHNQIVSQNFISIATDSKGFIYALDSGYGLIYVYDVKSNLIGAFAGGMGNGNQLGVFSVASSIALNGTDLLVSDSLQNTITVFKRTGYGDNIFTAQEMTLKSDYLGAEPYWKEVIEQDAFYSLALRGLAKAAYDRKDYKTACEYAKEARDAETYSLALKQIYSQFLSDHWTIIFLLSVFGIALLIAFILISIKKRLVLIRNEKIRVMMTASFHPFDRFNAIKYQNKGSWIIATVLVFLYFLSSAVSVRWSDFRYTTFDPTTYNSLMQLAKTAGLIVLWSVSNWMVSTLMHGRGRLKEVFIVSSYSVFPLIISNLICTPLSYLMTTSDSTLLNGIGTVAIILCGIMLFISHMIIHDFSFGQVVGSMILTVIFMILIVFVLFMIGILLSQFWSFLSTVILELIHM